MAGVQPYFRRHWTREAPQRDGDESLSERPTGRPTDPHAVNSARARHGRTPDPSRGIGPLRRHIPTVLGAANVQHRTSGLGWPTGLHAHLERVHRPCRERPDHASDDRHDDEQCLSDPFAARFREVWELRCMARGTRPRANAHSLRRPPGRRVRRSPTCSPV